MSMAMTQDPNYWRYRFHICLAYIPGIPIVFMWWIRAPTFTGPHLAVNRRNHAPALWWRRCIAPNPLRCSAGVRENSDWFLWRFEVGKIWNNPSMGFVGKIFTGPLNTFFFVKFSLKPIHWIQGFPSEFLEISRWGSPEVHRVFLSSSSTTQWTPDLNREG